ncbi:hypothetical protein EDB87DRAFT_1704902 [Lactarius vividus]|nr:hypothetical protein EDB87DRAFT_1704902 [Lactarius vividus]
MGNSDPYFVVHFDHETEYTSSPTWNELWHLKNVPTDATLAVKVRDKDKRTTDDFVGKFETVAPGAKEVVMQGPPHRPLDGVSLFKLTRVNDARLYWMWENTEYAKEYAAARTARCTCKRRAIGGLLEAPTDVLALLYDARSLAQARSPSDPCRLRVKPVVYTYDITDQDETPRFSESSGTSFVDFASKYALHANCAKRVSYSDGVPPAAHVRRWLGRV